MTINLCWRETSKPMFTSPGWVRFKALAQFPGSEAGPPVKKNMVEQYWKMLYTYSCMMTGVMYLSMYYIYICISVCIHVHIHIHCIILHVCVIYNVYIVQIYSVYTFTLNLCLSRMFSRTKSISGTWSWSHHAAWTILSTPD